MQLSNERVSTICLPKQEELIRNLNGQLAIVIGWGSTKRKSMTQDLSRKLLFSAIIDIYISIHYLAAEL